MEGESWIRECRAFYFCSLLLSGSKTAFVEGGGASVACSGEVWSVYIYGCVRRGVVKEDFSNIIVGE